MKTIPVYAAYKDHKRDLVFFGEIGKVYTADDMVVDPETIWHLTNHGCWNSEDRIQADGCEYVPNEHDHGFTNDDVAFQIDGTWYVAKQFGWDTSCHSVDEAKRFIFQNAYWLR